MNAQIRTTAQKRSLALNIRPAWKRFESDVGPALELYVGGRLLYRGDARVFGILWDAMPRLWAAMYSGVPSEGIRCPYQGMIRFHPNPRNGLLGWTYSEHDLAALVLFKYEVQDALEGRGAFVRT